MSKQRSSSGTRSGTNDLARTIEDMRLLSVKNITAENLQTKFNQRFIQSYPDATEAEMKIKLTNLVQTHDWGGGQKLGTRTELAKSIKETRSGPEIGLTKLIFDHVNKTGMERTASKVLSSVGPVEEESREQLEKEQVLELEKKKGQVESISGRRKNLKKLEEKMKEQGPKVEEASKNKLLAEAFQKLLENKRRKTIKRGEVAMLLNQLGYDAEISRKKLDEEGNALLEWAEERGRNLNESNKKEIKLKQQKESAERRMEKRLKKEEEDYYKTAEKYYKTPETLRGGEPPKPPRSNIVPFDPKSIIQEEDHKEEEQFKKINRKDVGKIDNGVKTEKKKLNTHVDPTVPLSDIKKAIAKQKDRLKLRPAKITFHRLGKPIGQAADKTF